MGRILKLRGEKSHYYLIWISGTREGPPRHLSFNIIVSQELSSLLFARRLRAMEPDHIDMDALGPFKDGSSSQGVYIYKPSIQNRSLGERPSKRRKVQSEQKAEIDSAYSFEPLLNGDEPEHAVKLRYETYQQLWSEQEAKIQISTPMFMRESRLLSDRPHSRREGGVVVLESGDAPNLKTTLKNIIRAAVTNTEGNDGYQKLLTDREGPRLLAYDLDLLSDYVNRKGVKKLVLAFRDSEAFDPTILTDLLLLLNSWLDRIPFTLLFGISTSVELFEGRLPRSTVALLRGKYFEIHDASNCVDRIYERLQADPNGRFWLGRNITAVLFERSNDYFQTPEAFSRVIKYSYMTHFFANPLSVLLANDLPGTLRSGPLCEAIRNLPSFRGYCEHLLDVGSFDQARRLLEDDEFFFQEMLRHLRSGQQKMRDIFQTVRWIQSCRRTLNLTKRTDISELSIRAMSGELLSSSSVGDMMKILRSLDSKRLGDILSSLPDGLTNVQEFRQIKRDLDALLQDYQGAEPLRSEYDSRQSVVATTVVQQRVKLSKGKSKVSKHIVDYTRIIDHFYHLLESYLTETLLRPQDLCLHEVFFLDMRSPLKETFTPRPRFAIERALSNPFDYLISTPEPCETKLSTKQPATAILFQLYLESGSLVNVYDIWQAFYAVFESEQGDSCDERMILAMFYRSLSELKAFGFVKSSRKKIDHVTKSAWMGL
ncbi:origin recognition complex subunit 3, putative [Aspergillus fumigatus A1163]|uniref:Origin recognition complex subunit 3 n=1 Tax=Aspergillus fumigatus (strain CBS 144.89 / FGSC A1163 / CEA10) TaxID=451804 RepID=B0YA39_ASPFC|nr:origin recognition complex subunit 3, putative [Aspergillus fumigatus A1163]